METFADPARADGLPDSALWPVQGHPRLIRRISLAICGTVVPVVMLTLAGTAIAQVDILQSGDSGDSVRAVQNDLSCVGYTTPADGIYGDDTEATVQRFQRDRRLRITDGKVGPETQQALQSSLQQIGSRCGQSSARPGATASSYYPNSSYSPNSSYFPNPTAPVNSAWNGNFLRLGSTGADVKQLQQRLCNRPYRCAVTGKFDYQTEQAVMQFQRDKNLTADGIVGRDTWNALDIKSAQVRQYVVSIPMDTQATLPQVQQFVRDAAIDRTSRLGPFIRAGVYSNRKDADELAKFLRSQRFDAQVRHF